VVDSVRTGGVFAPILKPRQERMDIGGIRIPIALLERLDEYAEREDRSRSYIIRKLIAEGLDRVEDKRKKVDKRSSEENVHAED
jgi:predicted DNA-binding protein